LEEAVVVLNHQKVILRTKETIVVLVLLQHSVVVEVDQQLLPYLQL
jgi:hypothetical protein